MAIFVSVLLAFAAEQWRDDINEKRRATATLELVRAELELNLAELRDVAPSREQMLQDFVAAMATLQKDNTFPTPFPEFAIPEITNIAYELATDSGAVTQLSTDGVLVIARAYDALADVEANADFLDRRNAQIRYDDGEQYLSGFIYYANRAIISEPDAIERLQEAIAVLTEAEISSSEAD
ncbi:MAG: hypothetical protein HRU11_09650 [Parvularculaceae bacterium]|nr:hypothetical protein [Parvularculaceae bacterium]